MNYHSTPYKDKIDKAKQSIKSIAYLYALGYSLQMIAEQYGVQKHSIKYLCKKHKLKKGKKQVKKCPGCNKIKLIDEFHVFHRNGIEGYYLCVTCERTYHRKRRARLYASKPMYRLNSIMSAQIRQALNGTKKGRSWKALVGYSIKQLKNHLERQFTKEMSWKNIGSYWHIDHICTVSFFKFNTAKDYAFQRCWALKNLRPLEAKENIRKSNKLIKPFQLFFDGL